MHALEFLYEDDYVFAVNKPPCIHTVSKSRALASTHITPSTPTIASLLIETIPSLASAAPYAWEGGVVQRLDFETSGILLGAKDRTTWGLLHDAIRERKIQKEYVCLVEGIVEGPHIVEGYIGSRQGYRRSSRVVFRSQSFPRSQWSHSTIWSEQVFTPHDLSLVRVHTSTGCRHQVRVQLASLGHPLLGDSKYGAQRANFETSEGSPSFFLHAHSVRGITALSLPMKLTATLPQTFLRAVEILSEGASTRNM
jgi:23S rRNA-/tRNA-specific pseudouridylate synthase